MRFFTILILVLTTCGTAWAGDGPKPNDFAYGATLETPGQFPVYETTVPLEVYRGTTRPDLGDLRVFNAAGDVVPHVVAPGGITEEEMTDTLDLAVFPIREGVTQTPDTLSVLIHSGGSEVNVQSGRTDQAQKKKIVAYLLDATQVTGPVSAVRLEWTVHSDTFLLPATLEASDDLKSWRTVIDDAVIAQFSLKEPSRLTSKDLLQLPPTQAKYFRLTFRDQDRIAPEFEVTQAHVTYVTGKKSADRQWTTVAAAPVSNDPKSFVFDLGAELPVDRLEVLLPEGNHAVDAEIDSSAKLDDLQHPKTLRFSGLIYRLKESGRDVSSGPLSPFDATSRTPQRYWYLDLKDDSSGFGQDLPSLKAGWVPEKLVFVAQGQGPYTLAYGSAVIRKATFDSAALLQLEDNSALQRGIATLAKTRDLGGPSRLLPPPPAPPSMKEIWGKRLALVGMVLATLLLGFMAYRIARQMA